MYTLCVIDMQQFFLNNGNDAKISNVAKAIRQAIDDDAAIFFVEYNNCGDTVPQLTDIAKQAGATKVYTVTKVGDDGSEDIVEALSKHNLDTSHLKVVGVNTDCCVYRTVYGLKMRLPASKIEVIADACHSNWSPQSHQEGLRLIRGLGCTVVNDEAELYPPDTTKSIGEPF